MQEIEVARRGVSPDLRLRRDEYNFRHFRTKHLLSDMQATLEKRGLAPGAMAPDFALPGLDGAALRLSELRGKPTLLHFGSFT
jgi:peroxiredoxin